MAGRTHHLFGTADESNTAPTHDQNENSNPNQSKHIAVDGRDSQIVLPATLVVIRALTGVLDGATLASL
jgi:hypothetical protein